jgi:hypothetical protein
MHASVFVSEIKVKCDQSICQLNKANNINYRVTRRYRVLVLINYDSDVKHLY